MNQLSRSALFSFPYASDPRNNTIQWLIMTVCSSEQVKVSDKLLSPSRNGFEYQEETSFLAIMLSQVKRAYQEQWTRD